MAELDALDFREAGIDEAGQERIKRYFARHPPAFLGGAGELTNYKCRDLRDIELDH